MKKSITSLFLLPRCTLFAQIAQPILPHLADLPSLPTSTLQESMACKNKQTGECSVDKVFKAFSARHLALQTQINGTVPVANTTMPDTSFVQQVKNMTPEQQQAWAMQYAMQPQQTAAAKPMKLPNQQETTFIQAYSNQLQNFTYLQDSIGLGCQKFTFEFSAKMESSSKQREQLLKDCPQVQGGEGDIDPEPKCASDAENQYQNWLETYYKDWARRSLSYINKKKSEIQNQYGNLENLLAQASYMSGASDAYKNNGIALQSNVLTSILALSFIERDVWSYGCKAQDDIQAS